MTTLFHITVICLVLCVELVAAYGIGVGLWLLSDLSQVVWPNPFVKGKC